MYSASFFDSNFNRQSRRFAYRSRTGCTLKAIGSTKNRIGLVKQGKAVQERRLKPLGENPELLASLPKRRAAMTIATRDAGVSRPASQTHQHGRGKGAHMVWSSSETQEPLSTILPRGVVGETKEFPKVEVIAAGKTEVTRPTQSIIRGLGLTVRQHVSRNLFVLLQATAGTGEAIYRATQPLRRRRKASAASSALDLLT